MYPSTMSKAKPFINTCDWRGGLIENRADVCTQGFKQAGDVIVMLGENKGELGGSEYLKMIHNVVAGRPPELDGPKSG